jgi:hypothetical protein
VSCVHLLFFALSTFFSPSKSYKMYFSPLARSKTRFIFPSLCTIRTVCTTAVLKFSPCDPIHNEEMQKKQGR